MTTGWTTLKLDLVNKGALSEVFTTHKPVEWKDVNTSKHEPLLIGKHADKLSEAMERCLVIRREIRELEILAVKSAVDYELFVKTSALDEEMETLKLLIPAKDKERKGHEAAVAEFGKTTSTDRGFGAISDGRAAGLAEEIVSAKRLETLIQGRWKDVRDYQAAYHERFNEAGNAHNYGERAANLHKIFTKEVTEAAERAIALASGIKSIYSWATDPLPNKLDLAALDDFALWLIDVRKGMALLSERETPFDLVVPLVQPWAGKGVSLMTQSDFDTAIKSGVGNPVTLKFTIDKNVFFGQDVRLMGVGLAFGNKYGLIPASGIDSIQTADGFVRLAATVVTPAQLSPDGNRYNRPPITLGNVSLHQSGQPTAYAEGVNVENVNPTGDWEIRLHPWVVWKDANPQKLSDGILTERIRDLKLMFRAYAPATF